MNTHPYLRAFLAGIFVPTLIMPALLAAFLVARVALQSPIPIESGLIFPLALVPTLWGLWSMLWLKSQAATNLSIGVHGAILPFLMLPAGATVAKCAGVIALGSSQVTWFQAIQIPYAFVGVGFIAGVAIYYLVWKYMVGFLNQVLGIA
jgi:hypothetical protein